MNESFLDAHGDEIGACAIFDIYPDPEKIHFRICLSKFHPFSITLLFCTHREKIDLADSEKRTPEVKSRPFLIIIPEILSGNRFGRNRENYCILCAGVKLRMEVHQALHEPLFHLSRRAQLARREMRIFVGSCLFMKIIA